MKIQLSEPIAWGDRASLPRTAGVYLIYRGEPEPIYIGETGGKGGLYNRLKEFHRCATTGEGKHSGGRAFHKLFHGTTKGLTLRYQEAPSELIDRKIIKAYVTYVERRLIWEHVERVGTLPKCNSE